MADLDSQWAVGPLDYIETKVFIGENHWAFIEYVYCLHPQKGDVIDVIAMNASGLWRGVLHSRVGNFKFINVELLSEKMCQRVAEGHQRPTAKYGRHCGSARGRPRSVEELLQRMNLEVSQISIIK